MIDRAKRARRLRNVCATLILGSLTVLSTAGCGDDDDSTVPENRGTLEIRLTDEPFPYSLVETATVTIDSVRVHYHASAASDFVTVDAEVRTIDVLELTNGMTETIVSTEVQAGTIDRIVLHISESQVVLVDDRSFDVDLPSSDQGGVMIDSDELITIEEGRKTTLILDFDVNESFASVPEIPVGVGDIVDFQFDPTLRIYNESHVGSVAGAVVDTRGTTNSSDDQPVEDAMITAYLDDDAMATTITGSDGDYRLLVLRPGTYTIVATANGYFPDSLTSTVLAGDFHDESDFVLELEP